MTPVDNCIIGAGISGLAYAWKAKQSHQTVCLLEHSDRTGGSIRSFREGPWLAEEGPHTLQIGSRELHSALAEIPQLQSQWLCAKTAAKQRFLVRNQRIHPVPTGPIGALTTPLLSFKGKLRFLREPFIAPADSATVETVAEFASRRLGSEAFDQLIDALIGGVYAGDGRKLLLRHAFPKLDRLEQNHGSLIRGALALRKNAKRTVRTGGLAVFKKPVISFAEGMEVLPKRLAEAMSAEIVTAATIRSIEQKADRTWHICYERNEKITTLASRRLVLALPAHSLERLPLPESLAEQLKPVGNLYYPPVTVLSLGFAKKDITHRLDGFGALVPGNERAPILGVLFPSSIFPHRAPPEHVLLTAFLGGSRSPQNALDDPDQLLKLTLPYLQKLVGLKPRDPIFYYHKHWPRAIPQYDCHYPPAIAAIEHAEATWQGLHLIGNYRGGIALNACLENQLC
jgi:oxygen-dependent protoporphyrinogen oxidase